MSGKKILFCASASSHILNFHIPYIKELKNSGFTVHTSTDGFIENEYIDKSFAFTYEKGNRFYKNISTIFRLVKIIRKERYDIISTHAMLAGFLCRFGAIFAFDRNVHLIHICHGYLFNDNGSLKSKIIILIEKILSFRTDLLLVMNNDDYAIAKKYKLCKKIEFINGMGIDIKKPEIYSHDITTEIMQIKERYNIPKDKIYLLCVGEFSKRKNQRNIIHAFRNYINLLSESANNENNYHLIFLGAGSLLKECQELCKELNISQYITFCGHVSETDYFYKMSYCVIAASKYEGLPFNIMEALYYNTPVIASDVKGHKDLICNGLNGYLYEYDNNMQLANLLKDISDSDVYTKLKSNAFLDEKYYLKNVKEKILNYYGIFSNEDN